MKMDCSQCTTEIVPDSRIINDLNSVTANCLNLVENDACTAMKEDSSKTELGEFENGILLKSQNDNCLLNITILESMHGNSLEYLHEGDIHQDDEVSCPNLSILTVQTTECNSFGPKELLLESMNEFQSDTAISDAMHVSLEDQVEDDIQQEDKVSCFDVKKPPIQITGAWKEYENVLLDNFTKGCKWAPDGSCLLTCSDDNKLRLFNMPPSLWQENLKWEEISEMEAALSVSEAELIYDYCWYPYMSSLDPVTCWITKQLERMQTLFPVGWVPPQDFSMYMLLAASFGNLKYSRFLNLQSVKELIINMGSFLSSSRRSPVHMWDAFTGELRCSYRAYNHVDEIVSPHSVAFDADGQKIYCGFKNTVRIFEVSSPGRNFVTRPTFNKKDGGQMGIISCFAFTSANRNLSAAGSYSKTVGIYSEPDGILIDILSEQQSGVTHLCFSPDGTKLYSGGRKDAEILCWDIRNLGTMLYGLRRVCTTNQRMYFDISRCGQYIVSGNGNGVVTIWDSSKPPIEIPGNGRILEPVQFYQAHEDCVNGSSFHPSMPLLATSSGQRKFPEPVGSDEEGNNSEMFSYTDIVRDNSLRLWWFVSESK